MTSRDSKGRFTKPCKFKAAKMALKKSWFEFLMTSIVILAAIAIVTYHPTVHTCESVIEKPVVEPPHFDAQIQRYQLYGGEDYCYVLMGIDPETNKTTWLDYYGKGCSK